MSDQHKETDQLAAAAGSRRIAVPRMGLVLLVGVSGSGKSTFAARHFRPSEVISSDTCRAMVSDDENDQSATADAFAVLHVIVGTRLRRGLLTVVDATNVDKHARAALLDVARDHDVLTDAIVLDLPEQLAIERTLARSDRPFSAPVVQRQHRSLRRSLRGLRREGFRKVHVLSEAATIGAATIVRERSWNDRSDLRGPFDIIGDVHGCATELRTLLDRLGWQIELDAAGQAVGARHPEGRTAVFVGDLVDRGPDTPGVLRLVMGMVSAGTALCVAGNHEVKLVRALRGAQVRIAHGLAASLEQLEQCTPEFRAEATAFLDSLISHYVLADGCLVVAHAGLTENYHGRSSKRVRAFALYGDTTGEVDEFGLPVRLPWARDYRGAATVVYGHTPTPVAEWINNTICLDTGAVFGGELSALRYPEREIVAVPAEREWCKPVRPLTPTAPAREPGVVRIDDVAGTRWIQTERGGRIKIPEENAAAALEVMSRFAIDPRWLVHLPPTMSPASSSREAGYLEHPHQAFEDFAAAGVEVVCCQEKHMGSRAIAVLARDEDTAQRRFGVGDGSLGALYTRTGRSLEVRPNLVGDLREATAGLFDRLGTDCIVLDCEVLPWAARAESLIVDSFASVGAAARAALPAALDALDRAAARGQQVSALHDRLTSRLENAEAFRAAYLAHGRPLTDPSQIRVAPFQILAIEGEVTAVSRPHSWHMETLGELRAPLLAPTRHRMVNLASQQERESATQWWLELTGSGGEGMVVKPEGRLPGGKVQPGLKVRGREYLRIIYGPDYVDQLDGLRGRNLGRKRGLAIREYALGVDALRAFVADEPLWQVHQRVFGVLALESEPVDPRL